MTTQKRNHVPTWEGRGPLGPPRCGGLPAAELREYLLAEAPPEAAARVEQHLAACPACGRVAARVRGVLAFVVADGAACLARLRARRP